MNAIERQAERSFVTRSAFRTGALLALFVLACTVLASFLFVRHLVRQQIIRRDAEALYATTLMEQIDARSGLDASLLSSEQDLSFQAALLASRLKGVLGIRFFNTNGEFMDAFPATIQPSHLQSEFLAPARQWLASSRYSAVTPLDEIFIYLPQFATGNVARVPILTAVIPLGDDTAGGNPQGAAEFLVEATSIATEFRLLDRYLAGLALITFLVSGGLLVALLRPAFRRIEGLNRRIYRSNQELALANQQLALSARSAALGAISAHLMHGLKNPLASVSGYFQSQCSRPSAPAMDPREAQDALAAARRMQSLVNETMEVLGDARGQPVYDIPLQEFLEGLRDRLQPITQEAHVRFVIEAAPILDLPSRVANQAQLVLINLLENAIQVTPPGGEVNLSLQLSEDRIAFLVRDQGPGIAAPMQKLLFLPCKSTRPGGSGLGLAISRQIADHLGARLTLQETTSMGSVFLLELPLTSQEAVTRR